MQIPAAAQYVVLVALVLLLGLATGVIVRQLDRRRPLAH
jgi:hypothetical protein